MNVLNLDDETTEATCGRFLLDPLSGVDMARMAALRSRVLRLPARLGMGRVGRSDLASPSLLALAVLAFILACADMSMKAGLGQLGDDRTGDERVIVRPVGR